MIFLARRTFLIRIDSSFCWRLLLQVLRDSKCYGTFCCSIRGEKRQGDDSKSKERRHNWMLADLWAGHSSIVSLSRSSSFSLSYDDLTRHSVPADLYRMSLQSHLSRTVRYRIITILITFFLTLKSFKSKLIL